MSNDPPPAIIPEAVHATGGRGFTSSEPCSTTSPPGPFPAARGSRRQNRTQRPPAPGLFRQPAAPSQGSAGARSLTQIQRHPPASHSTPRVPPTTPQPDTPTHTPDRTPRLTSCPHSGPASAASRSPSPGGLPPHPESSRRSWYQTAPVGALSYQDLRPARSEASEGIPPWRSIMNLAATNRTPTAAKFMIDQAGAGVDVPAGLRRPGRAGEGAARPSAILRFEPSARPIRAVCGAPMCKIAGGRGGRGGQGGPGGLEGCWSRAGERGRELWGGLVDLGVVAPRELRLSGIRGATTPRSAVRGEGAGRAPGWGGTGRDGAGSGGDECGGAPMTGGWVLPLADPLTVKQGSRTRPAAARWDSCDF